MSAKMAETIVLCLTLLFGLGFAVQSLGKYNVDRTKISVSGASSGAAMATQLHVAYSATFSGAGLLAGNPYWCSQGEYSTALGACMDRPERVVISELTTQTTKYASSGDIDATNNMYNSRVFVLSGTLDSVVNPGLGQKAVQYYLSYVQESNIKSVFDLRAEHTFPTVSYGNRCDQSRSPYISSCNYNTAYEMLNHFIGGLQRPDSSGGSLPGQFYEFYQNEFINRPSSSSMDDVGFAYIPSKCVNGATVCRLHVAIHGCSQQREKIGDVFARNAGYNEVGELNNIIIIYPQTIGSIANPVNPMGCWDWWGYTVNDFATKKADQMLAIYRMVQKVAY